MLKPFPKLRWFDCIGNGFLYLKICNFCNESEEIVYALEYIPTGVCRLIYRDMFVTKYTPGEKLLTFNKRNPT